MIKIIEEPIPEKDEFDSPGEREEIGPPPGLGWTGKNGTWSKWRERHITIMAGFYALFSPRIVPKFPDKWKDEIQYYFFGWTVGKIIQVSVLLYLVENHREAISLLGSLVS